MKAVRFFLKTISVGTSIAVLTLLIMGQVEQKVALLLIAISLSTLSVSSLIDQDRKK